MDPIGPAIASSLAGLNQAERQAARDARKAQTEGPRDRFRRALDEAELTVVETESEVAVRGVAANEDEEARQDHREHPPGYPREGEASDDADRPRLDLNA